MFTGIPIYVHYVFLVDVMSYERWVAAYCLNIFINIYLLFGLFMSNLSAIIVWFSFTCIFLVFRVFHLEKFDIIVNRKFYQKSKFAIRFWVLDLTKHFLLSKQFTYSYHFT